MSVRNDWSSRHVSLRHRLVLLAVLVFAISRITIPVLELTFLDTISGTVITRVEFAFILFLAFVYAFLEFSARTKAETRNISAYSEKLQRTLHRIGDIRDRTALLFRSFDGAMMARRLDHWNAVLGSAEPLPSAADMKVIEAIRAKVDRLQGSAERLAVLLQDRDAERQSELPALESRAVASLREEARETFGLFEKMDGISQALEERRQSLDRAAADSRDVITDVRALFSNSAGKGAEDLNDKLAEAVTSIRGIQRELRGGSGSHRLDRYVFSVHLPKLVSLLLVLLSADAILAGALRLGERILDAVAQIGPPGQMLQTLGL